MTNLYKLDNFITRRISIISIAISGSALRLITIVVLGGLLTQACSSSSDIVEPPIIDHSELISSLDLEDSGFMGLVPILEPRILISHTSLHWFRSETAEYWKSWNTADGSLLQSQTVKSGLGDCSDFLDVAWTSVTHSGTQSVFTEALGVLCRFNLSNYSRTSATLNFATAFWLPQVISTEGSKVFLFERDFEEDLDWNNTHEFDSTTLQETREPFPNS